MLFRYLLPDCQCLALEKQLGEIPFLAFLISIKNTVPNLTEFRRLQNMHADVILSEHSLTVFIATKIFQAIGKLELPDDKQAYTETIRFVEESFFPRLRNCGGTISQLDEHTQTSREAFRELTKICDELYSEVVQYGKRLAFQSRRRRDVRFSVVWIYGLSLSDIAGPEAVAISSNWPNISVDR